MEPQSKMKGCVSRGRRTDDQMTAAENLPCFKSRHEAC